MSDRDERKRREDEAVADIERRMMAGTLSPEQADRELLELALQRFSYLPPEAIEELRQFGLELNEEPEMVETRWRGPDAEPRPPVTALPETADERDAEGGDTHE